MMVKKEADGRLGQPPEQRALSTKRSYGMLNVDKPSGPSSHQVSAWVKDMVDIGKAGHGGTLDPKVTGVLPVGLGRGARVNHSLLKARKEYVCHMHLHGNVSQEALEAAIERYTGEIDQLPPVRSAVKREERTREIYGFELMERAGCDVLFTVQCEAGTYIRKLCHDMGEDIGVGAHMAELRRTAVGPFTEQTAYSLQEVQEAVHVCEEQGEPAPLSDLIQPVERGVDHLAYVHVLDSAVESLVHGASLKVPGISRLSEDIVEDMLIAVLTLKGELVETGMARMSSDDIMNAENGIAVEPKQVFMRPSWIDGE